MDERAAQLDAQARTVRRATFWVGVGSFAYLLLVIAILANARFGPHAPWWAIALVLGFVVFPVVIVALRTVHASLRADAAKAQLDAAMRAVDELEAAQDELRRENGRPDPDEDPERDV